MTNSCLDRDANQEEKMAINIDGLPHGRESYVSYYGEYVLKRPLPTLGDMAREKWLAK